MYSWSEVRLTGATKHFAKKNNTMNSQNSMQMYAVIAKSELTGNSIKRGKTYHRCQNSTQPVSISGKLETGVKCGKTNCLVTGRPSNRCQARENM